MNHVLLLLLCAVAVRAADLPSDHAERMSRGLKLFEGRVRGILLERCFECHGRGKLKGGLDMRTRDSLLRGGDDGLVLVPFQPGQSRLLKLVRHQEEPFMPDKKPKLAETEIQALADWIEAGAPYSKPLQGEEMASSTNQNWWAFDPLRPESPPTIRGGPRHPIDRFLLAKGKGMTLAPIAEKRTLLRRASLDLLGLPPSHELLGEFLADSQPGAWERILDRLLASDHYGECSARHWMDVARFAESSGFEHDYDRPGAFQYRDFLIRAFNADLPYDRFLQWQLAGDEFEPDNAMALAATGFLGAGVFPTQITANEVERTRYDAMDDMLSTTGSAFLGLTIGCARCHDHKYDPISSREYYQLLSAFGATVRSVPELELDPERTRALKKSWRADHDKLVAARSDLESSLQPEFSKWMAGNSALTNGWRIVDITVLFNWWKAGRADWREKNNAVETHARREPDGKSKVLICAEGYPPLRYHTQGADFFEQTYFLKRGSTDLKNGVANLDVLKVLKRNGREAWTFAPPPGAKFSGRRRSVANWMLDSANGAGALAARVEVNRVWQQHFGRGIVSTPNDFGRAGALPTHPELLDWLAAQLIESGWRIKAMHKLIMTSGAYQQSCLSDPEHERIDPDNSLFLRRVPRRLEAENIRDSILAVSGALDEALYGPGTKSERSRRRSIYFTVKRSELMGSMVAFDQPEPLVSQGRRPTTTVAPQALLIMNGPQVRAWAEIFAKRVLTIPAADGVRKAYQLALARSPSAAELAAAEEFLRNEARSYEQDNANDPALPWTDFCQVLFGLNEFVYEN